MREQLALDVAQFTLDLVGVVDPFGVADGLNALISIGRGKFLDAALSGAGLLPYIGDLAKLGKLPRYAKSIREAIKLARTDGKFANTLIPALRQLKSKALDKIPWDKLPAGARTHLSQIKQEVDSYLKYVDDLMLARVGFGRIEFVGLIGGRRLQTLTQQEIRNAFLKTGLREAHNSHFISHFLMRADAYGIQNLNQFAMALNHATKRLGGEAGTVEYVFSSGRVAVVVNKAGELITFLPLR